MSFVLSGVKQIDTDELFDIYEEIKSQQGNRDVILLDVREENEYAAGHIPGVHLLPVSQFLVRYAQELHPEKEYIVICRSGQRSQMVCMFLQEQGFRSCANYTPGMLGWFGPIKTGYPASTAPNDEQ